MSELRHRLRRARDFQHAAELLAEHALDRLTALAGGGQPLRALVHLRSGQGYRDLVVVSRSGDAGTPVPSATAWRWMEELGGGVVIDIEAGEVRGAGRVVSSWGGSSRTVARLRGRSTTHVCALPLAGLAGRPMGMLALELHAPRFIGAPWLDEAMIELAELCDAHAPWVLGRPSARPASELADAHLPVVGPTMAPLISTLATFARFEETVLLRGPTGTGKSHLARWVHERSPRRDGPFVVVDLHAISETLREAELFGWRKGAFTGALNNRRGRVDEAAGGTLFLDEVDKLDVGAQGKLLRLLEERRFRVVGSDRDSVADVRFVVGTNADLEEGVADGSFLKDLYFRINVLPVALPSLEERKDEIAAWAGFMLERLGDRQGSPMALAAEAAPLLEAAPWPGNLRQLQSVVVRAFAFASLGGGGSVGADAVRRALALEGLGRDEDLIDLIRRAGSALVDLAQQRAADGETLDLEHSQALRGAALAAAVERVGEREAFELFGLGHRMAGGNHKKTLRRELARLDALRDELER